jgi:hypothetical protein
MKKLTFLFSTTFVLAFLHAFCCFLPIITLTLGLISLPFYEKLMSSLQPYFIILQMGTLFYGFYQTYFIKAVQWQKVKIGLWIVVLMSIFTFVFPYYHHAQAQKNLQFGKKIITNLK